MNEQALQKRPSTANNTPKSRAQKIDDGKAVLSSSHHQKPQQQQHKQHQHQHQHQPNHQQRSNKGSKAPRSHHHPPSQTEVLLQQPPQTQPEPSSQEDNIVINNNDSERAASSASSLNKQSLVSSNENIGDKNQKPKGSSASNRSNTNSRNRKPKSNERKSDSELASTHTRERNSRKDRQGPAIQAPDALSAPNQSGLAPAVLDLFTRVNLGAIADSAPASPAVESPAYNGGSPPNSGRNSGPNSQKQQQQQQQQQQQAIQVPASQHQKHQYNPLLSKSLPSDMFINAASSNNNNNRSGGNMGKLSPGLNPNRTRSSLSPLSKPVDGKLYAGPAYHKAPDASDLPAPSFESGSESVLALGPPHPLRESPPSRPVMHSRSGEIFVMEDASNANQVNANPVTTNPNTQPHSGHASSPLTSATTAMPSLPAPAALVHPMAPSSHFAGLGQFQMPISSPMMHHVHAHPHAFMPFQPVPVHPSAMWMGASPQRFVMGSHPHLHPAFVANAGIPVGIHNSG